MEDITNNDPSYVTGFGRHYDKIESIFYDPETENLLVSSDVDVVQYEWDG